MMIVAVGIEDDQVHAKVRVARQMPGRTLVGQDEAMGADADAVQGHVEQPFPGLRHGGRQRRRDHEQVPRLKPHTLSTAANRQRCVPD